jgi:competence ComEA-like helix-hairpin-helix protein
MVNQVSTPWGRIWQYTASGFGILIGVTAFTLALGGYSAAAWTQESAQSSSTDSAERAFTNACGKCHPTQRVTATRRTRSQWEEVITAMITARGAQVSDEDFDTILAYLTRVHGRVNVNRAPAADMVEVLEISDTIATAIVNYRREHGGFEDFDALTKVPGIDRDKLEQKRDAIAF